MIGLLRNNSVVKRLRRRKMRLQGLAVISFPKSGRTWLRFMLDQLGIWPRFTHENADRRASLEYLREHIRLSTHKRVIFLHRNPLDTVVSYYNHAKYVKDWRYAPDELPETLSEFLRHPRMGIRYILEFNKAWLHAADRFDEFLPVQYEELREDPATGLRRIVDFCRVVRVSDKAIRKAVEAGEFGRMRELEESGKLAKDFPGMFSEGNADPRSRKVRSGKIGNYRDSLSQEDIDYCIAQAREAGWPLDRLLAKGDSQLESAD
jgi:hypothetical protein